MGPDKEISDQVLGMQAYPMSKKEETSHDRKFLLDQRAENIQMTRGEPAVAVTKKRTSELLTWEKPVGKEKVEHDL